MAQQLNTDAQQCVSHKYIAHQTALLYVSPAAVLRGVLVAKDWHCVAELMAEIDSL